MAEFSFQFAQVQSVGRAQGSDDAVIVSFVQIQLFLLYPWCVVEVFRGKAFPYFVYIDVQIRMVPLSVTSVERMGRRAASQIRNAFPITGIMSGTEAWSGTFGDFLML